MGAFDVELARLGYRSGYEQPPPVPQSVIDRRAAVDAMHLARMPCPGSCGQRCPNRYCPAHNGSAYVRWAVGGADATERERWVGGTCVRVPTDTMEQEIQAHVRRAVATERERCAKLCEAAEAVFEHWNGQGDYCARAIREQAK